MVMQDFEATQWHVLHIGTTKWQRFTIAIHGFARHWGYLGIIMDINDYRGLSWGILGLRGITYGQLPPVMHYHAFSNKCKASPAIPFPSIPPLIPSPSFSSQ